MSMRVLYVAWEYPKLSETFVTNEIAALRARGLDVRVVSVKRPRIADMTSCDDPGKPIMHDWPSLPELVRTARFATRDDDMRVTAWSPIGAATIMRRCGDWRPHVVHSPFTNRPATTGLVLAKRMGCPFTMMAHAKDWMVDCSPHVLRRKVRQSALTFAISETTRAGLLRRCDDEVGAPKIRVVRAAVTSGPVEPFSWPEPYLVCVGRLVPKKGVDDVIRAMSLLPDTFPPLLVIGDGPELPSLQQLVKQLGVGRRVNFLGAQSHGVTRGAIAGATLAVMASKTLPSGDADGIPVALMEAGQLGTPVVTTSAGAIAELIVDGRTGRVVEQGSPSALAEALRLSLGSRETQALAERLRQHVASEFSADLQAERLEQAWGELIT